MPTPFELLQLAHISELGICVSSPNVAKALERLKYCKKQNKQFRGLLLTPSYTSPETEIWIRKKDRKNG